MGASTNLEVEVEVRAWDTEENSRGEGNDDYNIVVRYGNLVAAFHHWTEYRSLEIYLPHEELELGEIPDNVASAMQEWLDDSIVPWPETFDSRQGEIDREEATVDVTEYEDEDDEDGTRYRFRMWKRDFVDVFRDGERVDRSVVSPDVLDVAEQYIPSGVEYFSPL